MILFSLKHYNVLVVAEQSLHRIKVFLFLSFLYYPATEESEGTEGIGREENQDS